MEKDSGDSHFSVDSHKKAGEKHTIENLIKKRRDRFCFRTND